MSCLSKTADEILHLEIILRTWTQSPLVLRRGPTISNSETLTWDRYFISFWHCHSHLQKVCLKPPSPLCSSCLSHFSGLMSKFFPPWDFSKKFQLSVFFWFPATSLAPAYPLYPRETLSLSAWRKLIRPDTWHFPLILWEQSTPDLLEGNTPRAKCLCLQKH